MAICCRFCSQGCDIGAAFDFCLCFCHISGVRNAIKFHGLCRVSSIQGILHGQCQLMGTGIILCLCAVRIELVICEARNIHSLAVCHGELHGTAGGVDSTTLYISIFTGNGIVHGIQLFLRCRPASFGEIGSFGIPVGEARDFSLRTIDGNGFGILAFADGDGIIQRQTVGGDICLFVGTRGDGEVTIALDLCALRIHRIDGMSICCIFGCYGSDIGTALHFRGRRLQLADIDGVRIFCAGCHVRDLAGNLLIPCGITDRNSGRRRFPCTRSIRAVVFAIQIKAYYAFVRSSNRITT